MKLLVPGDLDADLVERIRAIDGVEVLQPETDDARAEVVPSVEVVFGGLSREEFRRAGSLRWIQAPAAGVDGVLTPELRASDVILTSAKGFVGIHLAEHAMALLLALSRRVARAARTRTWEDKWPIRDSSIELYGERMGIVGLGGTGRELAVRAAAFGMEVIAVDPEPVEVPECVSECGPMDRFHDLLERSRVVAVCAPLTPETEGMFDRQAFARMRSRRPARQRHPGPHRRRGGPPRGPARGADRRRLPRRDPRGTPGRRPSPVDDGQRRPHPAHRRRFSRPRRPRRGSPVRQSAPLPGGGAAGGTHRQGEGVLMAEMGQLSSNQDYHTRRSARHEGQ